MTDNLQPDRPDPASELVVAARTDRLALGRLFDEFYPLIFAYCMRRLVLRAVAEDVTSEVFLKVAGNMRDFSGTCTEDFRRWLFRIATNEINAHLRQSIRRRELLEAAVQLGRINPVVSTTVFGDNTTLEWEALYRALGELSDREQTIISLRYFAGLKHEQISEVLELKSGTIRVALSRALEKLRERLRDHDQAPPASPVSKDGDH